MRRWTFGMVAALVFVAGCRDKPNPPGPTTTTTTATEAPTSTKQAASIVAKHRQAILGAFAREDECGVMGSQGVAPAGNSCDEPIELFGRYRDITELLAALARELEEAKPVEQEVAALVDSTIKVAGAARLPQDPYYGCVEKLLAEETGGDTDPPAPEPPLYRIKCARERFAWEEAWRAMKPQLAAWEPYI